MGFIFFALGVRFDTTNEEGHLLHTVTGACVDLDPIATLLLQTALEAETKAQILATLAAYIDATEAQLEEALETTLDHLLTLGFLQRVAPPDTRHDEVKPGLSLQEGVELPQGMSAWNGAASVDWEFFLTGRLVNRPLPRFSCTMQGYVCWRAGTILLFMGTTHLAAFCCEVLGQALLAEKVRQRAWQALAHHLSHLRHNNHEMETEKAVRVARRELVFCQMLVRFLDPAAVCLVRSIAFCAYLRALGLPATVVIGKARFDLSSQYAFHAWTALAGQVVNDHAELQSGYVVMARFPSDE